MSNNPNANEMREQRLRHMSRQNQNDNADDSSYALAQRLQAETNAEIEASDSELATRLADENGSEVDYDALDRELAERIAAEEAPPTNYDGDEALARALAEEIRRETARPAPGTGNREPSPRPELPHPEHPAPAPRPVPRRPANRDLPHHPRIAAIIKLSSRLDPATLPADEKDCTICASTFGTRNDNNETEHPIRLRGCTHVFGHACIQRWLRSNTNCPQCRREYADELYSNVDIRAESVDEEFAVAYEDGVRREERLRAEEEGRPLPEQGGEEGDDPFFAEPSLQQIREDEAGRERLIDELGGGFDPRSPSPPPRQGNPTPRAASPARAASPPGTGFGYGRAGDPLPPPGTHPPGYGPGSPRPSYQALVDRMRREVEAERGYSGPYRDPGNPGAPPDRRPSSATGGPDRRNETPMERFRREIAEERGYSGPYRGPGNQRDYGTRSPPPGSYPDNYRYPPGSRPMTDEELEDLERQFGRGMSFGGGGRGRS